MGGPPRPPGRAGRVTGRVLLVLGLGALAVVLVLLRLGIVTDQAYHALVKDPERVAPDGPVIVAPADGTVLYVTRVRGGVIPEVVKRGVAVPIVDHLKTPPERPFEDGWLVGIYMNTFGVHINRVPNRGKVVRQIVFNGPHMDMTDAEVKIILRQLVPGLVSLRRLLGLTPFGTEQDHDFVLDSARETLVLEDERGAYLYVVRIADYYVGKILTWVDEGQTVARGQRLGMITWGSQTDLFIEATPGLTMQVEVGDYVYGGETVVARYELP
jgi:phosphatidylserine decarboxylase